MNYEVEKPVGSKVFGSCPRPMSSTKDSKVIGGCPLELEVDVNGWKLVAGRECKSRIESSLEKLPSEARRYLKNHLEAAPDSK